MKKLATTITLLALSAASPLLAELQLASPFGNHMVLQRQQEVPVWGTADAGAKVSVTFLDQERSTEAGADGKWMLRLTEMEAGGPYTLNVASGDEEIQLSDVLVGEVWLCGGQSNMERQLGLREGQKPIIGWESEVAAADYPRFRQLYVTQTLGIEPADSVEAEWSVCTPETVESFTAVGYFFGEQLLQELDVPIGIIHSSWGGTPAEAWTSKEALLEFGGYEGGLKTMSLVAQDPERANEIYLDDVAQWYAQHSSGMRDIAWDSNQEWATIDIPQMWEDTEIGAYDGIAWLRLAIDLPKGWEKQALTLHLGRIDDIDTTWVNGKLIGQTNGWFDLRSYKLSPKDLKKGRNTISVRVIDTYGGGGIWDPEQPPYLENPDGETFSLAGEWGYKLEKPYKECSPVPANVRLNSGAPSILFNGMINPLIPYAIKGTIFYQGEANDGRANEYRKLLPTLIADWRSLWAQGDFPFLFVQIAPFEGMSPEIREAQLLAWQETENTGMAVTIDCGDATDIHPAHKEPVGKRLALAARALAYGENIEYSGPVYKNMAIEGSTIRISFDHLADGLVAPGGVLEGFVIAGKDGVFKTALATIDNDTIVVSHPDIDTPGAVRYGWKNVASGNLFNTAGLPASPFRTDHP